jgi:hypothetical protein
MDANPPSYQIQRTPEHLREVELHMDGLEAMVKLRGGIYNLGMNGALNEIVCWYLTPSPSFPRDLIGRES